MGSNVNVIAVAAASTKEDLPFLPLIQIKAAAVEGAKETKDEIVTPKSENSILKPPTVCPPAPRKPGPARRKPLAELTTNGFCAVPPDLSSVFVKLPVAYPPKKRTRLF